MKLEYNDIKIFVPESWDDITLGDYETWYTKTPSNSHERIELIAEICKTTPEFLLNSPVEIFNKIANSLSFIFSEFTTPASPSIVIKGEKYLIPCDEKLSLGAWIDAEEVQREGKNTLSGLLAIACRPVNEIYDSEIFDQRRNMFADLPVSNVLPVLAFFLQCKTAYEQRIAVYSTLEEAYDLLAQSTNHFRVRGDGIKLFQIWPKVKFWILIKLLHFRLRKYSHFYSSKMTDALPKKVNAN